MSDAPRRGLSDLRGYPTCESRENVGVPWGFRWMCCRESSDAPLRGLSDLRACPTCENRGNAWVPAVASDAPASRPSYPTYGLIRPAKTRCRWP